MARRSQITSRESALAHLTKALARSAGEKASLRRAFEQFQKVTDTRGVLTVEFADDVSLVAQAPASKPPARAPAALAALLKVHRSIALMHRGAQLVSISDALLDPMEDWLEDTSLAGYKGRVFQPIRVGADVYIYHPTLEHRGEPALIALSHEGEDIGPPEKASLGGVLIRHLGKALRIDPPGAKQKVPKGELDDEGTLEGEKVSSLERFLSQYSDAELAGVVSLWCARGSMVTTRGIERLPNLQSANLSENRLERLEGIEQLQHLQSLDLNSNRLTSLQPLARLPLKTLKANNNLLTSLAGLERASTLERLDVRENPIADLGPLDHLKNLEHLDASGLRLAQLARLERLRAAKSLSFFTHHTRPTITAESLAFLAERGLMADEKSWLLSLPVVGKLPSRLEREVAPQRLRVAIEAARAEATALAPLLAQAKAPAVPEEVLCQIAESALGVKLTPPLLAVWAEWLARHGESSRAVADAFAKFTSLAFTDALEARDRPLLARLVELPTSGSIESCENLVLAHALLGDEAALVQALGRALDRGVDLAQLAKSSELKPFAASPAVKRALRAKPGPAVAIMKAVRLARIDRWLEDTVKALPEPLALTAEDSEAWVGCATRLVANLLLDRQAAVARMLPKLKLEPEARRRIIALLTASGALSPADPLRKEVAAPERVIDWEGALALAVKPVITGDEEAAVRWATLARDRGATLDDFRDLQGAEDLLAESVQLRKVWDS